MAAMSTKNILPITGKAVVTQQDNGAGGAAPVNHFKQVSEIAKPTLDAIRICAWPWIGSRIAGRATEP